MSTRMTEIIFNDRTGEFEEKKARSWMSSAYTGSNFLKRAFNGLRRAVSLFFSAIGKIIRLILKAVGCLIRLALICMVLAAGFWAYSRLGGNIDWESLRFWQQGQHLSMTGTVSRYPVKMELDLRGQEVTGFYYYTRQGNGHRLRLEGTADGSHLRLKETDETGRTTGHFDGTIKNSTFSGQFEGMKNKKMTFKIKLDRQNHE